MNLFKVNTFISMRICAGWSMRLLWSKLYRLSSCGWMFQFMCRYSLCSVVYRFLKNNKRKKNKFVSYNLFTMCKFQYITTNENMKKMTKSPGCSQQRRGSDCTAAQCMSLSSQACFTHFDTRILDYKTISLFIIIVFNHFRSSHLVVTSENLLKSLIW